MYESSLHVQRVLRMTRRRAVIWSLFVLTTVTGMSVCLQIPIDAGEPTAKPSSALSPSATTRVVSPESRVEAAGNENLLREADSFMQKLRTLARSPSQEERARASQAIDFIRKAIAESSYVPGRQIYVMDADGTDLRCLTADESRAFGSPTWSRKGESIAFDAWPSKGPFWSSHVYTAPRDLSSQRDFGPGAMPEWTPGDSTLLVHTYPGSDGRIVALELSRGARRTILDHQGSNPRLSPDAKRLAFIDRDKEIKVWDVNEKFEVGLRTLTFAADWTPLTGLCWSPDGRRLACVRQKQDSTAVLIVLSTDEADPLQVLAAGDIHRVVAWHPTRNIILFSQKDPGSDVYQLRLFDLDKSQSFPLANPHPKLQCLEMSWSRSGDEILFIGELHNEVR